MDAERLANLLREAGLLDRISDSYRPRSGALNQYDRVRLILACGATSKSLSATLKTAIHTYLNRNEEHHLNALRVAAIARGMDFEEYLVEVIRSELSRTDD